MAYYLGRDVKVWITTEDSDSAVCKNGSAMTLTIAQGSTGQVKVNDGSDGATFALAMDSSSVQQGDALSDLTGVDLGIGVTDEDITYMGQRSVLKAEIKKETTISLTKKKTGPLWDLVFNGDGTRSARWGIDASGGSGAAEISDGLKAPKDFLEGTNVSFGYRVHIQLKGGTEFISVPACQVTGHSVTLNADGTTEETMEFMSNATPLLGSSANVSTRMTATTI